MPVSETIVGIFTGLVIFLRFILEIKEQKEKEKGVSIDEALAKGDTALLDNLLDGQHKRVSEVLHSHN